MEDAIASEIGADQIKIKQPRFQTNDDFTVNGFGVQFDFIIDQSIFSHCGAELVDRALRNFVGNSSETGLILATFVHVGSMGLNQEFSGNGWVYPGCVAYHPDTILVAIRRSNLHGVRLPWFHPSPQWYAMAKSPSALPLLAKFSHLSGAVLRQPEFASSS